MWFLFDRKSLNLHTLDHYLDSKLNECERQCRPVTSKFSSDPSVTGRIGPSDIILDNASNVGTIILEADKLGVNTFLFDTFLHKIIFKKKNDKKINLTKT